MAARLNPGLWQCWSVVCSAGGGEYLQIWCRHARTHSCSLRGAEVFLKVKSWLIRGGGLRRIWRRGVGGRQTAIECLTSKCRRIIERGTSEKLLKKKMEMGRKKITTKNKARFYRFFFFSLWDSCYLSFLFTSHNGEGISIFKSLKFC